MENINTLPTIAKILSRFDGNRHEAMKYCIHIAENYPNLADEYNEYAVYFKEGHEYED